MATGDVVFEVATDPGFSILGGDGNDVLRGDRDRRQPGGTIGGNDIIYGGAGSDRIGGKAGNDTLFGDDGDDRLWGDDGDDILLALTATDFVPVV